MVFSDSGHRREFVYVIPVVLIIFSQEESNLISTFTTRLPCQGYGRFSRLDFGQDQGCPRLGVGILIL